MTRWRSLRVRLALLGFAAIYLPALLLFGVTVATDTEVTTQCLTGEQTARTATEHGPTAVTWTILALSPAAICLAWWWAGRAVRPIERVRTVADDIQAADLTRRIGLHHGPAEVAALAASFDAMLARLQHAAETQQRLIEEAGHELRMPLAVLVTNAEVLLSHPAPDVDLFRRGLERSRTAALRLQAVIAELLVDARGRARTINRRPADLTAIVTAIVEDAGVLAATRDIRLTVSHPPTAVCPVDEPTVTRAVHNLVDNAIRYSPPGSTVQVTVGVTESEATVLVADHGPGIPAAHQERVFQRFARGTVDSPGTGLGLAIARHVAVAHGGDLTLTSPGPDGDGCVFRLTLRR